MIRCRLWGIPCLVGLLCGDVWAQENPFIRGDGNGDGVMDISDTVAILRDLFGGVPVPCQKAADVNDSE